MAKDNFLKESVAEAKAIRETALANALAQLQESFKPRVNEMLSKKLRTEVEGLEEDTVEEQKKLDSSGIGGGTVTAKEPGPKKPSAVASSSSDIENKGQEIETFGEGFEPEEDELDAVGLDSLEAPEEMGGMGAQEPEGGLDLDLGPEAGAEPELGVPGEEGEDELDLESIIRELEADLHGMQQEEAEPTFEANGPYSNAHDGEQPNGISEGEAEGVEKDGKDVASVEGVPGGKKVAGIGEEVNLEEILREIEAENESVEESENIATENVELKKSLREHREVIQFLRNRIAEVNMLNSKLLYTTKIFRNFALTESQKRKVVEQFDRASTLREAKLVYSTLAESLSSKVSGATTSKRVVGKITEGASKTVASTKPKETVLTEGDTQVARLQKLAGIIRG